MIYGIDGEPAHDHLDGPLFFCGKTRGGDCLLRVHIAGVGEWTGSRTGDARFHQVDLSLHVGIEFYFFGHDDFALCDSFQQVFNVGILSNVLSGLVHLACYFRDLPHCRQFHLILDCCAW